MKATDMLKRFEAFLRKYEFTQMKLENGTILEADNFKEEDAVFIVTDDEKVPLPIGDYELEDGRKLIVVDEGVIGSIGESVEEEKSEEMVKENLGEHPEEEKKETMSYVSREELEDAVSEVKDMIEEVKAKLEEVKEEEKTEVEAMDDKEEKEELAAELSKPSTTPLKHNPEAEKKVGLKKIGMNRKHQSPMDRILEKINNISN
jgi:GTPase involved in cell partitioning and DNA repair